MEHLFQTLTPTLPEAQGAPCERDQKELKSRRTQRNAEVFSSGQDMGVRLMESPCMLTCIYKIIATTQSASLQEALTLGYRERCGGDALGGSLGRVGLGVDSVCMCV